MLNRPDDEGDLLPSARDLFTASGEAILVHDATDGTILDANPAAERLYGRDGSALSGTRIDELVAGDRAETDLSALADEGRTARWHVDGPDGGARVLDVAVRRAESGDAILSFGRDVTGGAARTEFVEQPFKRLQQTVSRRDIDFDEKVDELLDLGCEWLGVSVGYMTRIEQSTQTIDSAVGTHDDIQPGETAPLSETYCQHTLEAGDSGTPVHSVKSAAESEMLESDEYEKFGLSCYLGGEVLVDGETYGTICFADEAPRVRPFTEMERAFVDLLTQWVGLTIEQRIEQAARNRQSALLEGVFNSQRTQVGITDTEGRVVDANDAALEFVGMEPEELAGEYVWETPWFEGEQARERCRRAVERALDGEIADFEIEYHPEGGPTAFFSTNVRPVMDDGTVIRTVIEGHEITELRKRENRLERLSSATNELLYTHTESGVASTVTAIAQQIIDRPLAAMWSYDESEETLYPIGSTAAAAAFADVPVPEELPLMGPDTDEKAIFDDGEAVVIEDYQALENPSAPGVPLRTMLCLPLEEQGLLCIGSPSVEEFTESERFLLEILASTATAALDRVRREAELQAHRDELQRSNEALQEFAYIASHDLQEPLRMVSSYVDLLESEYGDELGEEATEYMDFAVNGAQRMQNMIDALLEYSRVETKGEAFETVDTTAVVDRTRDALQLRIDETDATISVGSLPTVRGDPDQLGQLFQNLLANALEYTSESGVDPEIRIDAELTGETATVTVSDNGPGIPDGMADDIFEIFNRGGNHGTDGTGIGLAVCRRIVRRHDGEIRAVDSEAGARFEFTLPVPAEVPSDE